MRRSRESARALKQEYQHRARIADDGSDDVTFKWHWPRGTFDERMSAREIAAFVLPHMAHILPYFERHPLVHAHFSALLTRLATWPEEVLDEVTPWIRRLPNDEEDEILLLDLRAMQMPREAPLRFDMGGAQCRT